MNWNRQVSDLETLMVKVLQKLNKPLTLAEVVAAIGKLDAGAFSGKTPVKSLYSIIYRRELRRISKGERPLFTVQKERNITVYSLNSMNKGKK